MYSISFEYFFFNNLWTLVLAVLLLSILIITNKNTIYSIIYLITVFICVALNLVIFEAHYLGLSYLLVYVGAVSIIFLFIIMLIDIRISETKRENSNNWLLSVIISVIYINLFRIRGDKGIIHSINFTNKINHALFNNWDGSIVENYDILSIGNIMYTSASVLLMLSLLILLLAMVGAIKINITSHVGYK